jgi:hypothetical protein
MSVTEWHKYLSWGKASRIAQGRISFKKYETEVDERSSEWFNNFRCEAECKSIRFHRGDE